MNRAHRRAVCVDCGSIHITSRADDGWLCLPCLDKRNDRLNRMVLEQGLMLAQQMDPDGPAVPCGCEGCGKDATVIVKVRHAGELRGAYGCDKHAAAAVQVAQQVLAQQ